MQLAISVIICAHNPHRHYLERVLAALKSQTLPLEQWELLLIDNASDQLLSTGTDLSWHLNARHVREDNLGLTPARLRGIQEAQAETLIFVDDDNVLDLDYLETALHISRDCPFLGAWGGQIKGEFEVPPPEWSKPYLKFLAIRELDQNRWSNLLHQHETTPCGAGICFRKVVGQKYAELVLSNSRRARLDRTGKQLMSCGDTDLAFTACDLGLGTGLFVALKLTHLIPANRLDEKYLTRLVAGIEYSHIILESFRGKMPTQTKKSIKAKLLEFRDLLRMHPKERHVYLAGEKAKILAVQDVLTAQI